MVFESWNDGFSLYDDNVSGEMKRNMCEQLQEEFKFKGDKDDRWTVKFFEGFQINQITSVKNPLEWDNDQMY